MMKTDSWREKLERWALGYLLDGLDEFSQAKARREIKTLSDPELWGIIDDGEKDAMREL